jgi:hypothetical protein
MKRGDGYAAEYILQKLCQVLVYATAARKSPAWPSVEQVKSRAAGNAQLLVKRSHDERLGHRILPVLIEELKPRAGKSSGFSGTGTPPKYGRRRGYGRVGGATVRVEKMLGLPGKI